jgi:hypothetical protein
LAKFFQSVLDRQNDVQEGGINIRPHSDGLSIFRSRKKLAKRQIQPIARSQNDRNDSRFARFV